MNIPGLKYRTDTFSIIELSPSIRTLEYCKIKFRVSLPYIVFIIRHQNEVPSYYYTRKKLRYMTSFVFFRFDPLKSKDNFLYHSCFPNVRDGGSICMGNGNIINDFANPNDLCKYYINCFFQSPFNNDMGYPLHANLPGSFQSWANMTVQDKEMWRKLPVIKTTWSLQNFIYCYKNSKPIFDAL